MGLALSIEAPSSVFRRVFGVTEAQLRDASARESFRLRVPDDLKDVVYTMRFDEASALYAEFGEFVTGMVAPVDEVLAAI